VKIVFVHGTGVRQPAFDVTFKVVEMNVEHFIPDVQVLPCYWGDVGSSIGSGLSVPLYDQTKSIGGEGPDRDELAGWALLYEDPLIELRLLAEKAATEQIVGGFGKPPSYAIMRAALRTLRTAIDTGCWPCVASNVRSHAVLALEAIGQFDGLDAAIEAAVKLAPRGDQGLDPARTLVARAITAGWVREELKATVPPVPAAVRDAMQQSAFEILGGGQIQTMGLAGDLVGLLFKPLKNLVRATTVDPLMQAAAWGGRTYRRSIVDGATPGVGDILLYQARGEKIRAEIARSIEEASNGNHSPVVLLAHSLGGIACIDLLIASMQPSVKGVITVGSQAPFLYEIGALSQLEPSAELPLHMPPWLNIYDRDDLLSFKALPVMKGGNDLTDIEVRSHQPFPVSHSAYWQQPKVWEEVRAFIRSVNL